MFVSGPVGTSTVPGTIRSAMNSTACCATGSTLAAGAPARRGRSRRGRVPRRAARGSAAGRRRARPGRPCARRARARGGRSSVVLSSVWLPCDGRDAQSSSSGLARASRSAIASSCPGSQSMRIGVVTSEYRVHLGRGRKRRLRAEARGGDRARGAGTAERLLAISALEQRDEQAGREGVARGGAVDGVDLRRLGARHLLPVVEQQRALGAERHRHEAVAALQHLELVAVDDGQVGVDVDRPRRRGVQAEEPGRLLPRADDGRVRNLELAEHGVALGEVERPPTSAFAPGATTIWFSPAESTRIIATPVGAETRAARTSSRSSRGSASSAKASSPTAQTRVTSAPSRAQATA